MRIFLGKAPHRHTGSDREPSHLRWPPGPRLRRLTSRRPRAVRGTDTGTPPGPVKSAREQPGQWECFLPAGVRGPMGRVASSLAGKLALWEPWEPLDIVMRGPRRALSLGGKLRCMETEQRQGSGSTHSRDPCGFVLRGRCPEPQLFLTGLRQLPEVLVVRRQTGEQMGSLQCSRCSTEPPCLSCAPPGSSVLESLTPRPAEAGARLGSRSAAGICVTRSLQRLFPEEKGTSRWARACSELT